MLKWIFVANLGGGKMVFPSLLKRDWSQILKIPRQNRYNFLRRWFLVCFFFLRQLLHWALYEFSCVKVASSWWPVYARCCYIRGHLIYISLVRTTCVKIANASTSNVISYHRLIVFTALRVLRTSLMLTEEADKSHGTCPCSCLKRESPIWTPSAVIFDSGVPTV